MKLSDFSGGQTARGFKTSPAHGRGAGAFTLIEMLVVFTIIGILAALITNLAAGTSVKKKDALIRVEREKLMTIIDSYHDKLGYYPPDNGVNVNATTPEQLNSTNNPLFYELTGAAATNNGTSFRAFNGNVVSSAQVSTYFKRGGFVNALEPEVFYRPLPSESKYAAIPGSVSGVGGSTAGVLVFTVPVTLEKDPVSGSLLSPSFINTWHYDSSSTNRHNPDSYDLWAVYSAGKIIVTNGNWNQ